MSNDNQNTDRSTHCDPEVGHWTLLLLLLLRVAEDNDNTDRRGQIVVFNSMQHYGNKVLT
jgi:hypothetical protein